MRALCSLLVAAAPALCATSFSTTPLPVAAGQELTLCAANVGRHKSEMTLKFVNVRTGAIVAQKEVTLAPVGAAPITPDPCLTTTASWEATVVGFVSLRASFFDNWRYVTASVQFRNPGESQVAQTVPLDPTNVPLRARSQRIPVSAR